MNSIPLIKGNTPQEINTSIIALKKALSELEAQDRLLQGTDKNVQDKIKQINELIEGINTHLGTVDTHLTTIDGQINALQPVDTVTSGNMHSVTSNAVAQALVNKLNNTKTLLLNSRVTGSTANLSDSIAKYKYLLVRFQTNIENDFMLIPVSANYTGLWYGKTLMISEGEGQLTDFMYKSTCSFSFSSNTQITQKVLYNNVNWQLRIQTIWGIK